MEHITPFNPLESGKIISIIVQGFESQPLYNLPLENKFVAQGVYGIFPRTPFLYFRDVGKPIYIGKATYKGGRKGLDTEATTALYSRLSQHTASINAVDNLFIENFQCRYLSLDEAWITMAESSLIKHYKPLWNMFYEGFGNRPGKDNTRNKNKLSAWDQAHPGRLCV